MLDKDYFKLMILLIISTLVSGYFVYRTYLKSKKVEVYERKVTDYVRSIGLLIMSVVLLIVLYIKES